MMKLIYPAVFKPFSDGSGGFVVEFPDLPGCVTEGKNLEEAMEMAVDAACGWILGELEDGELIPEASEYRNVAINTGEMVNMMLLDLDSYEEKYGEKFVRKSVTVPAWLNTFAEKNNLNFSKILQESLLAVANQKQCVYIRKKTNGIKTLEQQRKVTQEKALSYGYKLDNCAIVEDEIEAEVVRWLFKTHQQYIEHPPVELVCAVMNESETNLSYEEAEKIVPYDLVLGYLTKELKTKLKLFRETDRDRTVYKLKGILESQSLDNKTDNNHFIISPELFEIAKRAVEGN